MVFARAFRPSATHLIQTILERVFQTFQASKSSANRSYRQYFEGKNKRGSSGKGLSPNFAYYIMRI